MTAYDESDLQPPARHARIVILTSGTTGTPKGAPRKEAGIDAAVSLLSRMPLRAGWRTHIAAPLFHTWGFAHLALAMLLGSTVVLRRTFDPVEALRTTQAERCQSMVVIPVMLQRILALDPGELEGVDLSRVEVVASSGSALPATLAQAWMDRFGDNLYNIYGSTEVAYASIATPEDLRADPTSAGKPPHGTVVKILGHDGHELPRGETGRIFVGNGLLFEGYTNGGSKEVVEGLMSSGDLGWFDEAGRLHVAGRDDDMIVSGGENVFPQEVEDCLVTHEGVGEVAAVGVVDEDYGQRLRAFVVRTGEVSEDDLREHVKANLARFKVPREIVFLDELPRNAHGQGAQAGAGRVGHQGRPEGRRGTSVTGNGLCIGDEAPDFTLRDQFGQDVRLSDFRGRKAVVLMFFPFAFTGVCTGELSGVRDRLDEFLTFDTEVLTVSCDSVYALRTFAEAEGLNFPLLSDWWPHGAVSRAYEVFDEVKGAPRRSSYVIDREGRLRWSVHNANPDGRDLDEHLNELHAALETHLV